MSQDAALSAVLALVYDLPAGLSDWPSVLEAVADYVGAEAGQFTTNLTDLTAAPKTWLCRRDPADFQAYLVEHGPGDPRVGPLLALPEGAFTPEDIEPAEFDNTALVRDVLDRFRVRRQTGWVVERTRERMSHVTLLRDRASGAFDREETRRFALVAPHLARTLRLKRCVGNADRLHASAAAQFEAIRTATYLLDHDGRVLLTNLAGARLAEPRGPIRIAGGRPVARTGGPGDRLTAVVMSALPRSAELVPPRALLLLAPDGRRYVGRACALAPEHHLTRLCTGACVVLMVEALDASDAGLNGLRLIGDLADLFGLTFAEARLAVHIAEGGSVASAITRFGVSRNTIRTQLSSAMSKTGAASQRSLGTIVLSVGNLHT